MFRSLRSRLLLSYFFVITTVLFVVAVALFGFSILSGDRFLPTLQRLATVSASNRRELLRLRNSGAGSDVLAQTLDRTAAELNIRILVADTRTTQVLYDSADALTGTVINITGIARRSRLFATAASDAIIGRFQDPADGSDWLVYAQPTDDFRNRVIFYTQRTPTPLAFFREVFLRPIGVAGIVAFLLSIPLAFWITGSVAGPLRKMAGAAEAIAEGDYNQQLPLRGPEEVQRVATSFNVMATEVKMTQQAQRDFVSNVSHDLRTPITSIRGWSQALLDGTAVTAEEQQQAAGIIHNEAGRMQRLVNQLLDLARIESGQLTLVREAVDLSQLVTDVHRNLLVRAQGQKIHLTLETAAVPPIMGDPDRLMQVFTNLVDNALTHTPAGGRVHLAVREHGEEAVEAMVQDTGKGISSEELPRIFERFYQVDKSRSRANGRRGSGLGLAIVRELVEAHHGRIQAFSKEGQGTTFVVRLPVSDTPAASTVTRRQA